MNRREVMLGAAAAAVTGAIPTANGVEVVGSEGWLTGVSVAPASMSHFYNASAPSSPFYYKIPIGAPRGSVAHYRAMVSLAECFCDSNDREMVSWPSFNEFDGQRPFWAELAPKEGEARSRLMLDIQVVADGA